MKRAGTGLLVFAALVTTVLPAAADTDPFTAAATEFDVPRALVVAVGYSESRLDMHDGKPSQDNGFGLMHLVSNPTRHTLEEAASRTGETESDLRSDATANIRGGAAVLRGFADDLGLDAADRDRLDAWYPVVAEYGGATAQATRQLYADAVFDQLGVATPDRAETRVGVADYPDAIWNPASSANYAAGRTASISTVVIHVTQGSYAGTISWFQNPASEVSAHYVVRSSDGEVTHMVEDSDTAWHARSANASALGIEHEGFVDEPAWFTDAMYRSSAALTKWLCDTYGLAKTRDVIVGHSEVPGNDHTDPGANWDWDYYMSLVTA